MAKITLIVPIINNFQQAIEMLASAKTLHHEWTPVIVPQWELHWPLSKAWNHGLNQANRSFSDYALICNDDILFHPLTIDNLVRVFEEADPNVLMVTALNQRGQVANPYDVMELEVPSPYTIADSPDFSCFMVRPKQFLSFMKGFDENFKPAYYEDNDMHRRITLSGHRAITTTAAPYYHYGSQTQNHPSNLEGPIVSGDAFNRNAQYYCEKWGGYPGEEQFQTPYNDPNMGINDWR